MADHFRRDDGGAGTVLSLFGLLVCLLLAGTAIDFTNAWRNRELMQATADAAAHAGIVALLEGEDEESVLATAEDMAKLNMPYSQHGQIAIDILDATKKEFAFALRHYISSTNTLSSSGTPNAVVVTLERSRRGYNPVPTFLLGLVGINYWNIAVRGVAVTQTTERCNPSEGIFAGAEVTLSSQNKIGSGFCIHSQDAVWLPQNNTFAPNSWVSMPNLASCKGKCTNSANPGVQAIPVNMIQPDLDSYIESINLAFVQKGELNSTKASFFLSRPLDADLSAIDELGVKTKNIKTGDVIEITPIQFSRMREAPSGLTYKVTCADNGNGKSSVLQFGGEGSEFLMENAALITNCSINFGSGAKIIGSLIVTTREQSSPTLRADTGTLVGDPSHTCTASQRTIIMSKSKLNVPADFSLSNVTLVVGDDVNIAAMPNSSNQTVSKGLSIHASGGVHIAAQHTFESCENTPTNLIPELKVIKLVMPNPS